MSLIQVSDLSFSYEDSYDLIFEHVSFQIDTDWKLGFTGRNGRGKTTFLNLLQGKYEYSGTITSSTVFDYFPFPVDDPSKDGIDLICGLPQEIPIWQVLKEFDKLGLEDEVLYRPFNTLSNGERTKVMLAALFSRENHFLLIDEPTNHLDLEARQLVSRYLNSKKGFLLVSHDRVFLDSCVDHILSINKTDIEVQKGNFSSWYQNKVMRDEFELQENERLKKDISRLAASAKRTKVWGDQVESTKIGRKSREINENMPNRAYIGEKSRRMQQRRKNLEQRQERALEEKTGLLKNVEQVENLRIEPLIYHKKRMVSAENLSIRYGDREVCSSIDFSVECGERVSLQSKNGCGKSSILKLILGEPVSYGGRLEVGSGLKISYVSQDTSFLKGDLKDYAAQWGIDESLFKAILRKLDFSRVQFEKKMESFSEGQKKKVLIARSLCEKAHLYIWDEPLNFIDIYSRMQIEELLLKWKPSLLFVEHDAAFTERIATKIIQM